MEGGGEMKRYIDIEPFIRVLEMSSAKIDGSQFANGYNDATITILRALRAIPTADVVEVRHGTWMSAYEYALKVGCTDEHRLEELKADKRWKFCPFCEQQVKWDFNYCPRCGAKMDGERREK